MTTQEIKSLRIDSDKLLPLLKVSSLADAIKEPPLLDFTNDYTEDYCLSVVHYICKNISRFSGVAQEDREDIAKRINRKIRSRYTFGDLALFADMLMEGDLPIKKQVGNQIAEDRKLILFDLQSVMERLHVYDALRREVKELSDTKSYEAEEHEKCNARRKLTKYMLTHDYEGNDMTDDPFWDPEEYWYSIATPDEVEFMIMPRVRAAWNKLIEIIKL